MYTLNIPVIQGTDRAKRQSIHVSRLLVDMGTEVEGTTIHLVDPQDFDFAHDGNDPENRNKRYSMITQEADAFVFVIPEYNHSFPGSLKTLLDTELENYLHKPVGFVGVSAGPWGGIRGIESMVPVVREMGMIALSHDLFFPKVQTLFNDQGQLQDDAYRSRIVAFFDELVWLTHVIKTGMHHHPRA